MDVNIDSPIIVQLERDGEVLKIHLAFNSVAEAKRQFKKLGKSLETEGPFTLSFISEGPMTEQ